MCTNFQYTIDRFIPKRECPSRLLASEIAENICESSTNVPSYTEEMFVNLENRRNKKIKFRYVLAKTLGLHIPTPLHYFEEGHWPCNPRREPLLQPPLQILDLPGLETITICSIVDWSVQDYIATIYQNEVHFWHPTKQLPESMTHTCSSVTKNLKFSNDGNNIAITIKKHGCHGFIVWNCVKGKEVYTGSCNNLCGCYISAITWTADNNILTGCSVGRLVLHNFQNYAIRCHIDFGIFFNGDPIINMAFSSNYKYLSIVTCNGKCAIYKYKKRTISLWFTIKKRYQPYGHIIWTQAWHPWKSNLLVIASVNQMLLINVHTKSIITYTDPSYKDYEIDRIIFNPLSAELVVSSYAIDVAKNENAFQLITVLKDFGKVVDEIRFHMGRVPYLLWNSCGNILGTASADDNLCLWAFFGTHNKVYEKNGLKKRKTLNTNILQNPVPLWK